ncbi:RAD55 family ATPase [Methanospirillum sp.]|uniref:RAD55 family ATPase n=1 Tax=Methanospirillum sp. TaxID=45200 RepID=UPI00298362BD|nr:hypothetical protein [Methanospirillum sp.]
MYKYLTGIDVIDRKGGVNPGTNILVLSPSFCGGEMVASYLAMPRKKEYMIVIATETQSEDLIDFFSDKGFDTDYIGIIDAITRTSFSTIEDAHKIKYVGSPSDLTGMDIKFSQLTEEIMKGDFTDDPDQLFPTPIRYCIISLTSMLMFRKIDIIYQFLHVVTSKLRKLGSIGVFLLNNESFDQKSLAIVKQLMNIVVELRSSEEGNQIRLQGTMGLSVNWTTFSFEDEKLIISP